jgi:hypothetical protein
MSATGTIQRLLVRCEKEPDGEGPDSTLNAKGVGHHSFALPSGDISTSPPSGTASPFAYHGVPNNLPMSWSNRYWYTGTFTWWENSTYCRSGSDCNTGWSLKFLE